MATRTSVLRAQGGGGFDSLSISTCCTAFAVIFCLLGAILLSISYVSLNKNAFDERLDFLLNITDTANCAAEVALGNDHCIKDGYRENRWMQFEWYVLYLSLPIFLIAMLFVVIYLIWNNIRILWWFMALALLVSFVVVVFTIVVNTIYWFDCQDHDFCAQPTYVFDFTGEIKFHGADPYWIIQNVGNYVLFLGIIALLLSSLYLQYISAFALGMMRWSNAYRSIETPIGASVADEEAAKQPSVATTSSSSRSTTATPATPSSWATGFARGDSTVAARFNLPQKTQ